MTHTIPILSCRAPDLHVLIRSHHCALCVSSFQLVLLLFSCTIRIELAVKASNAKPVKHIIAHVELTAQENCGVGEAFNPIHQRSSH